MTEPKFDDENERLIWCTAFATYELQRREQDRFEDHIRRDEYTGPLGERSLWYESAIYYADVVLSGYRELKRMP